jgi:hypothetical protein
MKRLHRALAAVTLTAGLSLTQLPAASAASWGPIDPVSYSVKDITTSSVKGGCPERTLTVKAKKVPFAGAVPKHVVVFVDFRDAQDQYVGQDALTFEDPRYNPQTKRYSMSATMGICNASTSFGRYTVGRAELRYGNSIDDVYWGEGRYLAASDTTVGHFFVRRAAKASLKATRSGKRVTLSVSATRFNPVIKTTEWGERYAAKTRYSTYSGQKVRFEVKSRKTWKPLKTTTLSKGRASLKVQASGKRQYRAVLLKNSTTAGKTTATVRR